MLTKIVNGEEVVCSAEEEAEILAEWNANSQPPTAQEIDNEKDNIINQTMNQDRNIIKSLVLCINDGSIVPGANVTNAALKAAIKANL